MAPDRLYFDDDALTFGTEDLYFGEAVAGRQITTFADLIDEPNANKVVLAELYLAEKLIGFTQAGALDNTYQVDYLNEIIELNDGSNTLVRKEIEEIKENGVALTERASVADVESNAGSWFHNIDKDSYDAVKNGGFDSDTSGWSVYVTGSLSSVASGQSGNCLQIESLAAGSNGAAQVLAVIPGDKIQLTAYVKAGTEATYYVAILDVNNGTYLMLDGGEETAGDWSTQVDSGVLTIPDNCRQIRIYLFMTATGASDTIFFDTVVLSVTPAVPRLHIHSSGSDDPSLYTVVGYFYLRLATEGIILNGYYYEPYIHEKGMPSLKLENPDIYWGITQVSGGSLKLLNNSGFFDQISRRWLWSNKKIRILLGGEQLPYSEYQLLRTHIITDKKWTRDEFTLGLKPKMHDFYRKVPADRFTMDVYSSMDPDLEGEVIPIIYGECHSREAVPAFCIAQSLGSNKYLMKVAGHAIHSFMQAYIDYGGEDGWQTLSIDSEYLSSAEFCFTSGSYTPGRNDIKVALVGVESGGGFIEKPPHIMQHFLVNYCDVATSDISSSHLADSLGLTESTLALPIIEEMEALDVIDQICKSDLAFFDEDENGHFRYRTWTALATGSYATIDEKHVLKYDVQDETEQIFREVRVGYRYNPIAGEHLYITKVYTPGGYLYDQQLTLTHKTAINDKSAAERLGERLLLHTRQPPVELNADIKMAIVDRLLGDQLKLTLARSPFETAGGWDERIFELSHLDLSFFPIKTRARAFELSLLASNVGYWVASDISSYGAYGEAELANKGFWSDSAGYVVPGSETTLNISNWW